MAVRNTARLASLTLIGAVGITAGGEPIPDVFRLTEDENLRRYYADQERAARRLGDLARADFRIAAKNRATVTRLAYRPRFHNPGTAKMAAPDRRADPAGVGRGLTDWCRLLSARPTGTLIPGARLVGAARRRPRPVR